MGTSIDGLEYNIKDERVWVSDAKTGEFYSSYPIPEEPEAARELRHLNFTIDAHKWVFVGYAGDRSFKFVRKE